jgi:hypothetical protein
VHGLRDEPPTDEDLNSPDIQIDMHNEANKHQNCELHREAPVCCVFRLRDYTKHSHSAMKLLLRSFDFRKCHLCSSQCHALQQGIECCVGNEGIPANGIYLSGDESCPAPYLAINHRRLG